MRARCIPYPVALVCSWVHALGCGLASDGLLGGDVGGMNTMTALGRDAAMGSASGDDAAAPGDPTPGDEAAVSDDAAASAEASVDDAATNVVPARDAAPVPRPDGAPSPPDDSGLPQDGATASPTCHQCLAEKCSTQLTTCGPGSACIGYRNCDLLCNGSGTACSRACASTYSGGATAFSALSLCAFPCGATCVVQVSLGTP